jgi:hypothetical protein
MKGRGKIEREMQTKSNMFRDSKSVIEKEGKNLRTELRK